MPEAEDVITDAARHATVFARALWQRHRHRGREAPSTLTLAEVAPRLDLLLSALFDVSLRLRAAERPARPTVLDRLFKAKAAPRVTRAVPATDGASIWLPSDAGEREPQAALPYFRCLALTQAVRAQREAPMLASTIGDPLVRSVYLLLEARVVEWQLTRSLPGLASELEEQRLQTLAARPPLAQFPPVRRPLEQLARRLCALPVGELPDELRGVTEPRAVVMCAEEVAARLAERCAEEAEPGGALYRSLLFTDDWTGELRSPKTHLGGVPRAYDASTEAATKRPASARLARRPRVREAREDEDDAQPGAWMIQTAQPHEHAEDSLGMQRPTDRDQEAAPEEYADSVSELSEARLVRTPGRAKEVLLGDDELDLASTERAARATRATTALVYPEWDYRTQAYRERGACVHLLAAEPGPTTWVDKTLREHASMVEGIRRRFQALRSERTRLRRQQDGDEIDLEAYVELHADLRAGRPPSQHVYQTQRPARRETAILLLVDVSGSTDSWVLGNRRVIDVEKEALLLVCAALEEMRDPLCVLAFSGESASAVSVRTVKQFAQPYGSEVAARIAGLEPEAYTRAGAALRHASTLLMQQPARHRLLLLLSDGKPNDVDEYEGKYGIEDMHQAVIEARLQGIHPFCLTVDRQAASYLPRIFGAGFYTLLPRPELLPTALVGWLKHFMVG